MNTAFETYIAPARARPGFWRVILGFLLILLCWFLGMLVMFIAWTVGQVASGKPLGEGVDLLASLTNGDDPSAILIMLLSFAGIWLGVFTALTWLHGQSFSSVFAQPGRHRISDFLKGAAILPVTIVLMLGVGTVIDTGLGTAEPLLPFETWILWLGPVLVLVFLQATAEELLFRGYLLQQLAVRSRYWLVWAVLPSVLFGFLHYGGREDGSDIYYIATTAVLGLTFCTLVWRSGSLWPAIGLHVVNNVYALAIATSDDTLQGTQLWVFRDVDMAQAVQWQLGVSTMVLLALLSPLGRVFNAPGGGASRGTREDQAPT